MEAAAAAVEPGRVEISVNTEIGASSEPDGKMKVVWPKLIKCVCANGGFGRSSNKYLSRASGFSRCRVAGTSGGSCSR